jgi:hypothetical protein
MVGVVGSVVVWWLGCGPERPALDRCGHTALPGTESHCRLPGSVASVVWNRVPRGAAAVAERMRGI